MRTNLAGVRLEHRTILHRLNWQWRVFPYDEAEGPACFKTALTLFVYIIFLKCLLSSVL